MILCEGFVVIGSRPDLNRNLYSKRDVTTKIEVLYTKELCMSESNGCVEIDKYVRLDRFISRRETALPAIDTLGYGNTAEGGSLNGREPTRDNMSRDVAQSKADAWRNTQRIYVLFTSEKPAAADFNPILDFHGYIDSLACKFHYRASTFTVFCVEAR